MPATVDDEGLQRAIFQDTEEDERNPGEVTAIGIDLGSSHSRVAVWQGGRVEVIPDPQGKTVLPNSIVFSDTPFLSSPSLGDSISKPNPIFDLKRLIGRTWEDPQVREDSKAWGFPIANNGRHLEIEVDHQLYTPEELQSLILRKLKHTAEDYLGVEVTDAVITVPAYFNNSQRQATKEAGALAGLNLLKMINDPTASAITYGLRRDVKPDDNIVIFDLGSGTCDVAIVTVRKQQGLLFEVKAIAADTHLGGQDFDDRLFEYLLNNFEKKHRVNLPSTSKELKRLKLAAEEAKHTLSSNTEAIISVNSLFNNIDLDARVSRARFVALCMDLFTDALRLIDKALADAKTDKRDVSEVVLVGGSTRIPKVRSLLQEYFPGCKLTIFSNPEEIVVQGAAIQAALLTGSSRDRLGREILVIDVTPLSLGIETTGGLMTVFIKRNTGVPCRLSKTFTTIGDDQRGVSIKIFEGERALTRDNHLLGQFQLSGIPSARRGIPRIVVSFDLDGDGILNVTGEVQNGGRKELRISRGSEGLRRNGDVSQIVRNARMFVQEDIGEVEKRNSRRKLEDYVNYVRENLENFEDRRGLEESMRRDVQREDCQEIDQLCRAVDRWLIAEEFEETRIYEEELENLQQKCDLVVSSCRWKRLRTK
ncbi:heat shock 70 kDa protein-like [Diachasma alloeum]|uniref:heat shock 70 kDa protein-like n=1 Tax=Diachasma alloeum TaxID=454923 RepID=UPI0007382BB1|nr:heat shock 70 kDa protein-like [Diachasma alloeum]